MNIILIFLSLFVVGCGQKGHLYLPEQINITEQQ